MRPVDDQALQQHARDLLLHDLLFRSTMAAPQLERCDIARQLLHDVSTLGAYFDVAKVV